jgi:hypothetical protein
MLEAQVMTPTGGERSGRIVMLPALTGMGVTPVAYAGREAAVRDRASSACRAGHRTVLPVTATERRRERRPIL